MMDQNRKMLVIIAMFIFAIFPLSFVQGEFHAWCNLEDFGCGGTPNSMCIYDEALFKNQCLHMMDGVVAETWIRKYWLALINSFRDKVAEGKFHPWPAAANMKQLIWDDTLEAQARRWNFQCYLESPDDCNRNLNYNKTEIAQIQAFMRGVEKSKFREQLKDLFESIVRKENTIPDIQQLVDKGISEVTLENRGPRVLLASLMFANLEKVGASLIVSGWENTNESDIMRSNTYLAPMSVDTAVYKRGSPCSGCPEDWSCRRTGTYANLCSQSIHPSQEEYIEVNHAQRKFKNSFTKLVFVSMTIAVPVKLF